MTVFTVDIPVRFQHTDPAGIVFYPRYFEMINQIIEDWFAEVLKLDFQALHGQHGCGVPTVHIACDFKRPSRLGDSLRFALRLAALGNISFTLELSATCRGEERLGATVVLAYVALEDLVPLPIPDDLRRAMERFGGDGTARQVA